MGRGYFPQTDTFFVFVFLRGLCASVVNLSAAAQAGARSSGVAELRSAPSGFGAAAPISVADFAVWLSSSLGLSDIL